MPIKLFCIGLTAAAMLTTATAVIAEETGAAALKSADGKDVGAASLKETPFGVLLTLKLSGIPAGEHAMHFHAVGKCETGDKPFESAGGHYNPDNAQHGLMNEQGPHVGDMPNLHMPDSGTLEVEILNPMVTLTKESENTLLDEDGTAIIIHAKADDYTSDPAGNAGGRIACGVIQSSGSPD